jgi:hypothetical protein
VRVDGASVVDDSLELWDVVCFVVMCFDYNIDTTSKMEV